MNRHYLTGILGMFLLFLILTVLIFSLIRLEFKYHESGKFCRNHGYEDVAFDGDYNPTFGKVNCYSSYNLNFTYKEFNVTNGYFGLKEIR